MSDTGVTTLARILHDWLGFLLGRVLIHGSGHMISQERAISGVTSVDLKTIGHVHITVGDREELRVEAEDNLLPYLETDVLGGQLDLSNRHGVWLRPTHPIHFYVTVKSLESLGLAGSGSIQAPDLKADLFRMRLSGRGDIRMGKLDAREAQVSLSGAGNLYLAGSHVRRQAMTLSGSGSLHLDHLDADDVEVCITGAGDVTAREGQVKTQRITLSGAGSYHAASVPSDTTKARISGGGSIYVHVRDRLEARITGVGSVHYTGNPTLQKSISGVGRVRPISQRQELASAGLASNSLV